MVIRALFSEDDIRSLDFLTPDAKLEMLMELQKKHAKSTREPAQPPPVGGITLNAASRKYDVHTWTISRWVSRGLIRVLKVTKNERYIDEGELALVAAKYKTSPGRGKKTLTVNHS